MDEVLQTVNEFLMRGRRVGRIEIRIIDETGELTTITISGKITELTPPTNITLEQLAG